ncbi:hypothetical protein E4T66_18120 [Sinimarinibacterium sp. CAU 1509]|uniref:hypothetical protein n=1 Tax=Sinimarinibacterium sp. CAU 1509 TaxID=2562283 RepID=UPI0010ABC105|nr:hypothetical protein [Sinimarinibacterium sp. CAU 1509]TJY57322.1 hypothetical protein E4T66_18120 [Sinimarinibacterium sp. CAU 1509]
MKDKGLIEWAVSIFRPVDYPSVESICKDKGIDLSGLASEVSKVYAKDGKVKAIVLVREKTGAALVSAKNFVDAIGANIVIIG